MTRPNPDTIVGRLTEFSHSLTTPRLLDAPVLVSGSLAWACPSCGRMCWTFDGSPRCRRCGFWETAS